MPSVDVYLTREQLRQLLASHANNVRVRVNLNLDVYCDDSDQMDGVSVEERFNDLAPPPSPEQRGGFADDTPPQRGGFADD